jgi:hypothetical protein
VERKSSWPSAEDLGIGVGAHWAYRLKSDSTSAEVVEVEVLKIGTRRPARVQVQFVEDEHEGRTDWVPPVRLVGSTGIQVASQAGL